MKHRFTLFALAAALLSTGAWGDVLTPGQALARLDEGRTKAPSAGAPATLKLRTTVNTSVSEPAAYLFEKEGQKGYVVLAADDGVDAVLGYSDAPAATDGTIPPQMQGMLDYYALEIEALRAGNVRQTLPSKTSTAERAPIAPMVKAKWGQGTPYNDQTPTIDGQHCLTGCGATAVAQVLAYHRFPAQATGRGYCYYTVDNEKQQEFLDLGEPIDWANMPEVVPQTAAQKAAVAQLMKICGYAIHMNYGLQWSESDMYGITTAAVNHFGFDRATTLDQMKYHSIAEWEDLLYGSLQAGCPIVYRGYGNTQGGHIFVCDGYASDGYFHFNWGWNGQSDGYFKVSALNPNQIYTGTEMSGFTQGQFAVLNMKPGASTIQDVKPIICQDSDLYGNMEGSTLTLDSGFYNESHSSIDVQLGVCVRNMTDNTEKYYPLDAREQNLSLGMGWGSISVDVSQFGMVEGVNYAVRVVSRAYDGSGPWYESLHQTTSGHEFIVALEGATYKAVGRYSYNPVGSFLEVPSTLYVNGMQTVKVQITNRWDFPVHSYFTPYISYNSGYYPVGDGILVELGPGEVAERELTVNYGLGATDNSVTLMLVQNDYLIHDSRGIAVASFPDDAAVTSAGIRFDDGSSNVVNPDGFTVTADVACSKGVYAHTIRFQLYVDPQNNGQLAYLGLCNTSKPVFIEENGHAEATVAFSIPENLRDFGTYYVMPFNMVKGSALANSPAPFTLLKTGGVADAVAETDALKIFYDRGVHTIVLGGTSPVTSLEVYSADGRAIAIDMEGRTVSVEALPAGVYVVVATDATGARATAKIAR